MERATAFYRDKLGLRPIPLHRGTFFEFPDGSRFFIFPSQGKANGEHTQLSIMVDSVAEAMQQLREKGVEPERYDTPEISTDSQGITYVGGTRAVFFKDTEGNLVAVVEIGWWKAKIPALAQPARQQ